MTPPTPKPLTRAQVELALGIASHELTLDKKPNASQAVDDVKTAVVALYARAETAERGCQSLRAELEESRRAHQETLVLLDEARRDMKLREDERDDAVRGDATYAQAVANDTAVEEARRERDAERARAEEFKRIGQQFEEDMRKHFAQSCANLARAEKAERERDNAIALAEGDRSRYDTMCRAYIAQAEDLAAQVARLREALGDVQGAGNSINMLLTDARITNGGMCGAEYVTQEQQRMRALIERAMAALRETEGSRWLDEKLSEARREQCNDDHAHFVGWLRAPEDHVVSVEIESAGREHDARIAAEARAAALREAAEQIDAMKGGYTLDVATSVLVVDDDGPWFLQSKCAALVRALATKGGAT